MTSVTYYWEMQAGYDVLCFFLFFSEEMIAKGTD
jgi:hypothetical protein